MTRPADYAALTPAPHPLNRGVSLAIFVGSVAVLYLVRLVWFRDTTISLSWGLPLLLCLWHRDRVLLWAMAATFVFLAAYKALYVLPHSRTVAVDVPTQLLMQVINTLVIAVAVHLMLGLYARLERKRLVIEQANHELADRQEEIARQNEELQAQTEELAQQNRQIQQQAEEVQHQSEELTAQAEEIQQTNQTLSRREALLQTMMESLHLAENDNELPVRICEPVLRLFHEAASAVAIVERVGDDLVVLAQSGVGPLDRVRWPFARSFAAVVMAHDRTAFVDDLEARPDLVAPGTAGRKFRSVLATPLRIHGQIAGAVKIYSEQPRSWTTEQFRMIEWVAAQCALLLECHRLRNDLQRANAELDGAVAKRTEELRDLVQDLEHFSYTITHDLRAPLRAMHGFAAMLAEECRDQNLSAQGHDYLRRIGMAAARMDRLITDALSFSSTVRQEFKLEPVDIEQLLRGIVDSYPNLQKPLASVTLEGAFPRVLGNEAALTQCFANLLGNAVKFVAPGRTPHVRVYAERHDEWVRVWFEDDGIGIPEAMLARVFGMFQRLSKNYEGTGIGLALVKKVAERLGGSVGVESQLGRGSRFWLELKAA
ncbi:MAG: GAF domain-containing protein [Opitutae bacterium]|nr:GAF domain-containing protein [Opitutae bacterium]